MNRRQTLLALGGAGALAGARSLGMARAWLAPGNPDEAIAELAGALRPVPRGAALEIAADAIRRGATVEVLLGAVLKIGVEDVRPRPHGILHTVMMVHSSFALAEGASEDEAWLAALWNLDDLKAAQERDREEYGDWTLPPRPDVPASTPEAARAELIAALDVWDAERADRAVVALLAHVGPDDLFELLWPFAARCSAFLGHKVIYAAQLERALRRISWSQAEPAARSLVRALLVDRDTATWEPNRERAAALSGLRASGGADPVRARELYRSLRAADVGGSVSAVLDALHDGLDAESAWDALRLVASEVFHDRSGRRSIDGRDALLPVHAVTVVNAMGHVARSTSDPALRWTCLLEAAARLPSLRDWLVASTGLVADGAPLEALGEGAGEGPAELEEAVASGSPVLVCAHLRRGTTSVARYGARLRTSLLGTAREHHQHKYAAAVLEEGALAHPRLRPLVLAPAVDYVAHPLDEATETHRRSLAALSRAGVR